MTFTPQPRPDPPAGGGFRQYQADFAGELDGLSASVRPDALVLDPNIAYSLGPVAEGDDSDGPIAWAWRVRVASNGDVLLSRENDTRDAWGAETLLFTITGALPTEVDLTFEQAGRAVVCAERPTGALGASEVWLYYLNPIVPGFVFENFGAGRTPRVILDNPGNPDVSDVLWLYINPLTAALELRQQRDRYLVVYPGPSLASIAELALEETLWTEDNRLRVVMSRRNATAGTYTIELLDSTLYPFILPSEDAVRAAHPAIGTGELRRTLLSYGPEPFGDPGVSEDGIVRADGARAAHPSVLNTSTLLGNDIIIDDVSTPARLPATDAARPSHPSVLNTSTLAVPIIAITDVSTPARLRVEDAVRPAHPTVVAAGSSLVVVLITITQTGSPQLTAEDAFRPAHPAVLNTSTLA